MKDKEINELMLKINKKCKFPKYWNDFINKQYKKHNIFIKDMKNKEIYCTHCKNTFKDSCIRVGESIVCPKCNNNFRVYGSNYERVSFENSVILTQRINKQIIIRVFAIFSFFRNGNKNIQRKFVEYVRIIPKIGTFVGDNVYFYTYGNMNIYMSEPKFWTEYTGYRYFTDFPIYPYNKKKLIKGTIFEYAPIIEFQKRFNYYNFLDVLQIAAYESFELLWNMKLYNLSIDAKKLNKNGSFYKRFRVPKSYLKFMQENDIDYRELRILQLLKNEKLEDIKKYMKTYKYNYPILNYTYKNKILKEYTENKMNLGYCKIKDFKHINEYVSLKKFMNYKPGVNNVYMYQDYLDMSKDLALNYKSKKDLFPENLKERHDELQKRLNIENDIKHCFGIYLRFLELSKNIYEDGKYIIFPANSADEFVEEGKQQINCVNSYSTKYIEGETEIYFIRNLKNIRKSLVTLEFKDGEVRQKEQAKHEKTTEEQNEFINKWLNYRALMAKKEKIKTNKKEYDLQKIVA